MRPALLLSASFAIVAMASGCASSGVRPAPFPTGAHRSGAPASPEAPTIVQTALSLRGAPYRNGGSDPSGFDCSGLVVYVFARAGIRMPRTVAEQYEEGTRVPREALMPGDLVFFRTAGPVPSHIGIAVSGSEFVHAPTARGLVRTDALTSPYWAARFAGVRRVR